MQRSVVVLATSVSVLAVSACASESAECVSNDVGEVCADTDDGAINFRGDGLLPGSEVLYVSPMLEPIKFIADADGLFDPGNRAGAISAFADTVFTFDVTAIDADGNPLTGQIEISTG